MALKPFDRNFSSRVELNAHRIAEMSRPNWRPTETDAQNMRGVAHNLFTKEEACRQREIIARRAHGERDAFPRAGFTRAIFKPNLKRLFDHKLVVPRGGTAVGKAIDGYIKHALLHGPTPLSDAGKKL
jgi:hypothetical protein